MARDFGRSMLSGYDDGGSAEDADPRIGLVNLADVMLVLACGLMLALVSAFKLDLGGLQEVLQSESFTEVSDIEELINPTMNGGGLQEMGKVYLDPMTGKKYMLEEEYKEVEGAAGDSSEGATNDAAGGAAGGAAEDANGGAAASTPAGM